LKIKLVPPSSNTFVLECHGYTSSKTKDDTIIKDNPFISFPI